jgi:aminoglycoside phosphotransferase (APT) family kinase protein
VDDATWARGRGWALWKALITLGPAMQTHPEKAEQVRRVIEDVVAEHQRAVQP